MVPRWIVTWPRGRLPGACSRIAGSCVWKYEIRSSEVNTQLIPRRRDVTPSETDSAGGRTGQKLFGSASRLPCVLLARAAATTFLSRKQKMGPLNHPARVIVRNLASVQLISKIGFPPPGFCPAPSGLAQGLIKAQGSCMQLRAGTPTADDRRQPHHGRP